MAAGLNRSGEAAAAAARLIAEHLGEDTVMLDLDGVTQIADYFIIATVRSGAHMAGILRAVTGFLKERGIHPLHGHKGRDDSGWLLLDCGDFVIHLMGKEQRDFYDLERLWFRAAPVSF
jgi:ribosome-associated protein